jgi:hypothetical protein
VILQALESKHAWDGLSVVSIACLGQLSELIGPTAAAAAVPANNLFVLLSPQWREAESLALAPHSFARLKALPELRQIIAHTSLDAIHAAAGGMTQLLVEHAAQERPLKQRQREQRRSNVDIWSTLGSDDEEADDVLDPAKVYALHEQGKDASLLQHLAPGLRLCLAAEVAVGMLCSG